MQFWIWVWPAETCDQYFPSVLVYLERAQLPDPLGGAFYENFEVFINSLWSGKEYNGEAGLLLLDFIII